MRYEDRGDDPTLEFDTLQQGGRLYIEGRSLFVTSGEVLAPGDHPICLFVHDDERTTVQLLGGLHFHGLSDLFRSGSFAQFERLFYVDAHTLVPYAIDVDRCHVSRRGETIFEFRPEDNK